MTDRFVFMIPNSPKEWTKINHHGGHSLPTLESFGKVYWHICKAKKIYLGKKNYMQVKEYLMLLFAYERLWVL